MGVKLIGGDHSDPVEKWIEKVPESEYDIIASEKMVSTKPSKNLYRAIFQPFSTIVLLIHSLAKNLIHTAMGEGYQQNDHTASSKLAEKYDAELVPIDASAIKQIENFRWRYGKIPDLKAIVDWMNIIAAYKLLTAVTLSPTILIYLASFNFIIQYVTTILKMRMFRDQFMSKKLLERTEGNEIAALTGALHTPSIAGYLQSQGVEDIEVIGVPEIKEII